MDTKAVYDLHIDGGSNIDGKVNEVVNEEALTNALKQWVASFKGDYINNPSKGGYVTSRLFRPMRQTDVEDIKHSIRDGIESDFDIRLEILDLSVEPDYERRVWRFWLNVYSPDLDMFAKVDEQIRGQ